jgi:hypothetical protein
MKLLEPKIGAIEGCGAIHNNLDCCAQVFELDGSFWDIHNRLFRGEGDRVV